jgi:hypothetical protein
MKIYVSSTYEDLKEFRRAIYGQLRKLRIDTVAMEDYVAGEKRPLDKCLDDVANSDIYVGIFAWRYGYIPKEGNPESRSITELEYRAAGEHSKERLVFLLREDAPWTPSLMDTHTKDGDSGQQIERLREELCTRHGVGFFSTPDELAKEVSAAVSNVLLRRLSEVHDRGEHSREISPETTPPGIAPTVDQRLCLSWHAYKQGLEVAHSIGRIEDGAGGAVASGFLVAGYSLHAQLGSDLYLLTPAHIIVREKAQKSFGLTVDEAIFRLTIPDENLIELAEIAWHSPVDELDLSVARLKRQPEGVRGLAVADAVPQLSHTSGQTERVLGFDTSRHVIVTGHPLGGQLSFSLNGFLLDHDDEALQYVADTKPGSGGSPVLDHAWRAIGVHRLRGKGIPSLTGQGRVDACQAVSLPAVRQALRKYFG